MQGCVLGASCDTMTNMTVIPHSSQILKGRSDKYDPKEEEGEIISDSVCMYMGEW